MWPGNLIHLINSLRHFSTNVKRVRRKIRMQDLTKCMNEDCGVLIVFANSHYIEKGVWLNC